MDTETWRHPTARAPPGKVFSRGAARYCRDCLAFGPKRRCRAALEFGHFGKDALCERSQVGSPVVLPIVLWQTILSGLVSESGNKMSKLQSTALRCSPTICSVCARALLSSQPPSVLGSLTSPLLKST